MTFRYGSIPTPRLQAVKVVNNSVISKDLTSGESVKQKIPAENLSGLISGTRQKLVLVLFLVATTSSATTRTTVTTRLTSLALTLSLC